MDLEKHREAFIAWLQDPNAQQVRFDMHAQDPNDWTWLAEFIPGIIISSAGGIWPFQAEGLLHGLPFYYKDKQGSASLHIGPADGSPFGSDCIYYATVETGKDWEADAENFPRLLAECVSKLERLPFLWEFPMHEVNRDENGKFYRTGNMTHFVGRGDTALDGYFACMERLIDLCGRHWPGQEDEYLELLEVSSAAINQDERVFPDPEPEFTVR